MKMDVCQEKISIHYGKAQNVSINGYILIDDA